MSRGGHYCRDGTLRTRPASLPGEKADIGAGFTPINISKFRWLWQKRRFVLWVTSRAAEEAQSDYRGQERSMNHSINSADRVTHLKIVVVGLLCATLVAFIGTFAHVSDIDLGTAPLVKAG